MLLTLAAILIILWLVGIIAKATWGGSLHLLLLVGLAIIFIRVLQEHGAL